MEMRGKCCEKQTACSAVILNYNSGNFLTRCLISVAKTRVIGEIVVVDNASVDESRAYLLRLSKKKLPGFWPKVKIIFNPKNVGFSAGNNIGVKKATGDYILFLNPDTKVNRKALLACKRFLDRHPKVGAVTCRLTLANGQLDEASHRGFPTPWRAFCYFSGLAKLFPRSRVFAGYTLGWKLKNPNPHPIEAASGAFLMVRRQAGEEIGWWDEDYFFYGEDIDFCYRLWQKGWQVYFLPQLKIIHYRGISSGIKKHSAGVSLANRAVRYKAALESTRAMEIFYQKHYSKKYPSFMHFLVKTAIGFLRWWRTRKWRPYRIVIDARMWGVKHGGIGRYLNNLLIALKQNSWMKENQIILLVSSQSFREIKKRIKDWQLVPVSARHYSFKEQLVLPPLLFFLRPDLVHIPHFNIPVFYPGKMVVTIHDLIKHYFRGPQTTTKSPWFYWLKYWSYKMIVHQALRRARRIFVPSFFWQKKLSEDFDVNQGKILVTPEGVDPIFWQKPSRDRIEQVAKQLRLPKVFLVYTGSAYPHKNLRVLFASLKYLPVLIKLVVVSSRDLFTQRMERLADKLGVGDRVIFLGFVVDEWLVALYQKAMALVQPSLMEGFGLTGLEAMAAGLPVIAAKTSCLPEVYGHAALYFNPYNPKELAQKIKLLYEDKRLRKKLQRLGKARSKKFSWETTAQLTILGYQQALSEEG